MQGLHFTYLETTLLKTNSTWPCGAQLTLQMKNYGLTLLVHCIIYF